MTDLQKEFEATGYASWINADLYPDGKIYTQEYTQWLERQVLTLRQPPVSGSLRDCKEEWASKYDKTWEDVKRDFEYGTGLSKLYDFEEIMDMVAELYRKQ